MFDSRSNPTFVAQTCAVTATHPLAAKAGALILEKGGNAVDASFAIAAAIGVVEPWFSNIFGGGSWALLYSAKDEKVVSLEAVGPAPAMATAERYAALDCVGEGLHQANVPGAFDGWTLALARYGTMSLKETIAPAVDLAENGFPAGAEFVRQSTRAKSEIARFPSSAKIFLKDGRNFEPGETVVQKDLARTFREVIVAEEKNQAKGRAGAIRAARDFFYSGPIMKALVTFSRANGGFFAEEDFAKVESRFVAPITTSYRDLEVYENPPNSQGVTMLIGLNILEGYDLKKMGAGTADTIHLVTEATKLAFSDRHWYVGDPDVVSVPIDTLLSKEYAAAQRTRINMSKAMEWPIDGGVEQFAKNTTAILARDQFGNAMATTTSIGSNWIVMGDTGIVINNRMPMYDLEPGLPNTLQPGKKVRHTSNPAMAFKNGKLFMLWACTGVDAQPQAQIQGFLNVVDFGQSPAAAAAAPRYITHAFPASRTHQATNVLALEKGKFAPAVLEALAAKGHKLGDTALFGNMNMIVLDEQTGKLTPGVDPRLESHAVGW
jgi:gamma-glutamyltranspeptidase/glutathione hydrolase